MRFAAGVAVLSIASPALAGDADVIAVTFDRRPSGVYDFDVKMQVELIDFNGMTVPSLIRYNGNWKAIFRKREHGVFTATLYDFKSD